MPLPGLQVRISRQVFAKLCPRLAFYCLGLMYRVRRVLCILIHVMRATLKSPHGRTPNEPIERF